MAATVIRCNDTDSVGYWAGEYPRHLGQSIPGDRHEHVRRVHAAFGRIGAVEQITGSTMAPVHGKLEFRCSDFAECGVVRCVFAICLAVSVLFRKIPYINRLFAL